MKLVITSTIVEMFLLFVLFCGLFIYVGHVENEDAARATAITEEIITLENDP
jgi:hypothetical protein